MNDNWVVIYAAQGEADEQQVCAFLEANDIPTAVQGEALRKTHAFVLNGLGEVLVRVPPEHADKARNLLERVDRGELRLDEID
ncbi:MAG: hypothetical protein GY906_30470 [bacterium]|nr:hypothetical protein [bacterium]